MAIRKLNYMTILNVIGLPSIICFAVLQQLSSKTEKFWLKILIAALPMVPVSMVFSKNIFSWISWVVGLIAMQQLNPFKSLSYNMFSMYGDVFRFYYLIKNKIRRRNYIRYCHITEQFTYTKGLRFYSVDAHDGNINHGVRYWKRLSKWNH